MSNKVTNIYIDTTGFCDEAVERVKNAFNAIIDSNGIDINPPLFSHHIVAFDECGEWQYFAQEYAKRHFKNVGLWELESIAFRCKQEKKEEPLPTRNIYIDARKLSQEERLNAYQVIRNIATGYRAGWLPCYLADDEFHHEGLILFDIFAINGYGNRLFFSGDRIDEMHDHLQKPQELTFDQLMSLAR